MSGLLTLEEAQAQLLALAPPQEVEELALSGPAPVGPAPIGPGRHRYFARDITAHRTQPATDLSAMDGYAIAGDGPWVMVGESRAGAPYGAALEPGQCTRISTGAHVPKGADRVLIQENATVDAKSIAATEPTPEGRHVRKAGFDFRHGDTVLSSGERLTAASLALAIAAGNASVPVIKPPTVAVLDSGDELARIGEPVGPHQIPASNGAMIAAMLHPYVGDARNLGPVADDADALAEALQRSEDCQILITSGGASVGDHDLIQQALKDWGADLAFWKVAIKPGKPLMVATREGDRGRQVILGLPGNPVSSYVTCFLFALPLIRAAMGAADPMPRRIPMVTGEDLPATVKRREFLRGIAKGGIVRRAASQDSSALRSLAMSNCLIDRLAGSPEVTAGAVVEVYNLENG